MPKNLKNSPIQQSATAPDPTDVVPAGRVASPSKKRPAVKKTAARKTTASKKTTVTARAPRKPSHSGKKSAVREPSDSEISVRAYFIAEERSRLARPGEPANDWLDARRQLLEEAQQRAE